MENWQRRHYRIIGSVLTLTRQPKFMLLGLVDPRATEDSILTDFEELSSLVVAYGAKVAAASYQNNTRGDEGTYIGQGKAMELVESIKEDKIDVVVINDSVKPRQLVALHDIFIKVNPKIVVWDRVDLILGIFESHAKTAEAKLQIKLAAMRHMGPRIYGMGMVLSQQGGGIGTRGIGETNVELMKRHWRTEVSQVNKQLEKIIKTRAQQMANRKRNNLPTVSIVGYTNAGKTTLFNRLCGKKNTVKDALFVTLDSTVGTLYLPHMHKEIFVTDTIGFIKNLPTQLIDAFKSTLMETVHADLILHVVDASDPKMPEKVAVVMDILAGIEAGAHQVVLVFNKSDQVDKKRIVQLKAKYADFHPQPMSAKSGEGIVSLIQKIEEMV